MGVATFRERQQFGRQHGRGKQARPVNVSARLFIAADAYDKAGFFGGSEADPGDRREICGMVFVISADQKNLLRKEAPVGIREFIHCDPHLFFLKQVYHFLRRLLI